MPNPFAPFVQDVLTRAINVHWARGGAIFVIGDDSGQIWRCKAESISSAPNIAKVGVIGASNLPGNTIAPGQFNCGSFAKVGVDQTPTFLLAGTDNQFESYDADGMGHGLFLDAVIMLSKDGLSWETVYNTSNTNSGGALENPTRMIWDEQAKQFYLDVFWRSPFIPGVDSTFARQTWASATGRDWQVVGHHAGDDTTNPSFDAHCKYKWTLEVFYGTGFANGQFGLNPARKGPPPPVLGNIVADGLLITLEDMPPVQLGTINFAGGLWARNNREDAAIIEVSADDGATWKAMGNVEPYDPIDAARYGEINVICAGAI